MKKTIRTAALILGITTAVASTARADGYISPFVGVNFGGAASDNHFSDTLKDSSKFTYGFDAGYMGAGIFGVELDFAYTNDFYGKADNYAVDSHVFTVIPNLIIGIPIGGQTGGGFRPYFTAGLGLVNRSLDITNVDLVNGSDAAWSVGGGFMGYFADHIGIRGDYRYIRAFDVDDISFSGIVFKQDESFAFSRASVGVIFRF